MIRMDLLALVLFAAHTVTVRSAAERLNRSEQGLIIPNALKKVVPSVCAVAGAYLGPQVLDLGKCWTPDSSLTALNDCVSDRVRTRRSAGFSRLKTDLSEGNYASLLEIDGRSKVVVPCMAAGAWVGYGVGKLINSADNLLYRGVQKVKTKLGLAPKPEVVPPSVLIKPSAQRGDNGPVRSYEVQGEEKGHTIKISPYGDGKQRIVYIQNVLSNNEFTEFKRIIQKTNTSGLHNNDFFVTPCSQEANRLMMTQLRNSSVGDLVAKLQQTVRRAMEMHITISDKMPIAKTGKPSGVFGPYIIDYRHDTLSRAQVRGDATYDGKTFTTSGSSIHVDRDNAEDGTSLEKVFINFSLITTHEPGTELQFFQPLDGWPITAIAVPCDVKDCRALELVNGIARAEAKDQDTAMLKAELDSIRENSKCKCKGKGEIIPQWNDGANGRRLNLSDQPVFRIPMGEDNSIAAWWTDMWPHKLTPVKIKHEVITDVMTPDEQHSVRTTKTGRRKSLIFQSILEKAGTAEKRAAQAQTLHRGGNPPGEAQVHDTTYPPNFLQRMLPSKIWTRLTEYYSM